MPINHLDAHLGEHQLIATQPLAGLRRWRLGIDGGLWLRRLLKPRRGSAGSERIEAELALTAALGGTVARSTLEMLVRGELEKFRAHQITPLFVFHGLGMPRGERAFAWEDARVAKRAAAWELAADGRRDAALGAWAASNPANMGEYAGLVAELLEAHGAECVRAPYSAWAQLAYLESHPRRLVDGVLGGPELLLWPVSGVVLGLDWDGETYSSVSRGTVLQSAGVANPEAFVDACLLAGFDWLPAFPLLGATSGGRLLTFQTALDAVAAHRGSGMAAVRAAVAAAGGDADGAALMREFFRAKCAVRYHPVLALDGAVRPIHMDKGCPADLEAVMGARLPDMAYLWLALGVLSPGGAANALVQAAQPEAAPLDNDDAGAFGAFSASEPMLRLRGQALGTLAAFVAPSVRPAHVALVQWPSPQEHLVQVLVDDGMRPLLDLRAADRAAGEFRLLTNADWVGVEQRRQQLGPGDALSFPFVIHAMQQGGQLAAAVGPAAVAQQRPAAAPAEIAALALAHWLELREFAALQGTTLTLFGGAYLQFVQRGASWTRFPEQMLVFLELLRLDVFAPVPGDDAPAVTLLAQIAALLPLRMRPGHRWAGPFDRELLHFDAYARAVRRGNRALAEAIVAALLLEHFDSTARQHAFLAQPGSVRLLMASVPFRNEPGVALGVAMRAALRATLAKPGARPLAVPAELAPGTVNLGEDLRWALEFALDCAACTKYLASSGAPVSSGAFEQAARLVVDGRLLR